MATLKELYTTLKSRRDMNIPVDDKFSALPPYQRNAKQSLTFRLQ